MQRCFVRWSSSGDRHQHSGQGLTRDIILSHGERELKRSRQTTGRCCCKSLENSCRYRDTHTQHPISSYSKEIVIGQTHAYSHADMYTHTCAEHKYRHTRNCTHTHRSSALRHKACASTSNIRLHQQLSAHAYVQILTQNGESSPPCYPMGYQLPRGNEFHGRKSAETTTNPIHVSQHRRKCVHWKHWPFAICV